MRVSKDQGDKAYSPTASQRRVWWNDQEVANWVTADEFRRVVVTADGQVHNGSVRVERLAEDSPPPEPEVVTQIPADVGFVGAGLVFVKPDPKSIEAESEQVEVTVKEAPPVVDFERPGNPDESVVVTQSERLPESDSQE